MPAHPIVTMSRNVRLDQFVLAIRMMRSLHLGSNGRMIDVSSRKAVKELKLVVPATSANASMPYTLKTYPYSTLKTEHLRHKVKCDDSTINTANENKLMLLVHILPSAEGVVNKTLLSFFKMDNYLQHKSRKMTQG